MLIQEYLERGNLYFRVGDLTNLESAKNQYLRAINLDPNQPEALSQLGKVYYILYEKALWDKELNSAQNYWNTSYNCFRKSLEYKSSNPDPYFGLATLHYCAQHYDRAIEQLKKVKTVIGVEQKDIIAEMHYELGRCYNAQKKYDLTLEEFNLYIDILPEGPHAANVKEAIKLIKTTPPAPEQK